MTTELEQEFFKVFKVEPISKWHKCKDYSCVCCDEYDNCSKREFIYPEITDRKLLEMIIIRATNYKNGTVIELEPDGNIEDLKYEVLRHFIDYQGNFDKHQIQPLFKERE